MLESQTHRKLIFGAVEVGFVLTRVVVGYWLVLETGELEWLLVGPKETSQVSRFHPPDMTDTSETQPS